MNYRNRTHRFATGIVLSGLIVVGPAMAAGAQTTTLAGEATSTTAAGATSTTTATATTVAVAATTPSTVATTTPVSETSTPAADTEAQASSSVSQPEAVPEGGVDAGYGGMSTSPSRIPLLASLVALAGIGVGVRRKLNRRAR